MINLTISHHQNIDSSSKKWFDEVKKYLTEEREGKHSFFVIVNKKKQSFPTRLDKAKYEVENSNGYKKLEEEAKRFVDDVLSKIVDDPSAFILADQTRIEEIKNMLEGSLRPIVPIFKKIFEKWYKELTTNEDASYSILKDLNIRTCPYCNRNYTFTIKRARDDSFGTRPEFDHFYNKSQYPLLALSFFNLVPCCHTCNHSKSTKEAGINPYFMGFSSMFCVSERKDDLYDETGTFTRMNVNDVLHVKDIDDFSVGIPGATEKEVQNINTFGINKLYNEHKDYVMELIDKANAYNSIGAQNLIDAFQGIGHSPMEVFDFVWGRHLDDAEHVDRPLSKLTSDVLTQIGIKK